MRRYILLIACSLILQSPVQAFTLSNFSKPESMIVDPETGFYYVSNINGSPFEKDGNGFISKISANGNISILKFIGDRPEERLLNAPKGLAIVGSTLYVTDLDTVKGFDKETGKPTLLIDFKNRGAKYLNDLAVDDYGDLFVSDMMTNHIFKISLKNDHAIEVFKAGKVLGGPNGLIFNPKSRNLIVVTWQTGRIMEIETKSKKVHVLKRGLKTLDGVDYDYDGNLYVSSFDEGKIYRIARYGRGVLSIFQNALMSPADISCDKRRRELLVPSFKGNTVLTLPLQRSSE
ncbi:MAG TPA: SMP-30/gluconolactonase/LRE family protein [Candidatus Omnitrophota bacterium]|nr:SMP-30/gluconolactonase/LRE family protein [Candidatus Omnitrophota bacterium]